MKILHLSDSTFTNTGFSTVSLEVLNGLADKGYDCSLLGHNYLGQDVPANHVKLKDGTPFKFNLIGCRVLQNYCQDLIMPKIRELKPDFFGILLDSVTSERNIPILNKRNFIEILSMNELYYKYKSIGGIKTLSVKINNYKGSHKLITEWKEIKGIERRFVKNYKINNISQKFGNTRVTEKHSLICKDKSKLIEKTPLEVFSEQRKLLRISNIPFKERKYSGNQRMDLMDFLDLNIFDYDDKFIWIKTKTQRKMFTHKIKRYLDKEEILSFIRLCAAYISEGCASKYKKNYCIIVSNNNKKWLQNIGNDVLKIFKKKPSISNFNNKTNSLVLWSVLSYNLMKDLCGIKCRNKKIPSFIYELNETLQLQFLKVLIEGDGTFHKPYKKEKNKYSNKGLRFGYTTLSLKLISGLSYLLKQLRINFSIGHNQSNENYNITNTKKHIDRRKTFLKEEKYTGFIYDICVEDNENFVDACGLIVCKNTFMTYPWILNLDFAPAISYFYFPSDGGGGLPDGCEAVLRKVNIPIAMSKFAQKQVKEVYGIDTHYIPHGVNIDNFHKLDNSKKTDIRKKWNLENKFVIGTVARNQPRKMLDRTVQVAKKICKQHDDIMFFMHCDPMDGAASFNILKLIERHNLQNRFIFSGMKFHSGFSYEQLNEVYNIMDIYLSTTSGEGWGICTTEAMACEVPAVITDYTTTKEIVMDNGQSGEAVKLSTEVTGSWMVDRAVMDVDDCVDKINKLYKDENLRREYGKNGRKKVERLYSWPNIIDQWDKLFKKYKNV